MSTTTVIILVLVIAVAVFGAIILYERRKTRKLRVKFGPEYDRLIQQEGGTRRAEAILESRQKRVEKFHIRPLTHEESERCASEWRAAQSQFVDDPRKAVAEADRIIDEALRLCGYPVGDFEQQAADLSVEHARVVEDYRSAHKIVVDDERGQATTEDLRRAMQLYRNLFEHVIGAHVAQYEEVRQ